METNNKGGAPPTIDRRDLEEQYESAPDEAPLLLSPQRPAEVRAQFEILLEFADEEYIRLCIRTDPNDLEREYLRVPGDFAFWEDKLQLETRALDYLELDLVEREAQVYDNLKGGQKGLSRDDRLGTEGIAARVTMAPKVQELRRKAVAQRYRVNALKAMVRSIEKKAHMVQSFGAYKREGLKMTGRMS